MFFFAKHSLMSERKLKKFKHISEIKQTFVWWNEDLPITKTCKCADDKETTIINETFNSCSDFNDWWEKKWKKLWK